MHLLALFVTILFAGTASVEALPTTCVASAPNGKTLSVHQTPSTAGPVIGGVGIGTCDIRVTNQCEGTMCVIVLPGLNGWVEMSHITGSPVTPPGLLTQANPASGEFVYAVTGGSGTMTTMGVTRDTPVDAGGTITLRQIDPGTIEASLPQATAQSVLMTGRGAGPWTGNLGDWGGMPIALSLTLNGLGAPTANLRLAGANQIAAMDIRLDLAAASLPSVQGGSRPAPSGSGTVAEPAATGPCRQLEIATQAINSQGSDKQRQDLRSIYVLAGLAFSSATPSPEACAKALDLIAQQPDLWILAEPALLGYAPSPPANAPTVTPRPSFVAPAATPQPATSNSGLLAQACAVLQDAIRPLLRGAAGPGRSEAMRLLAEQGIVSAANGTGRQCAAILAGLVAAGFLANETRPWDDLASARPAAGSGGANLLANRVRIGIDASDFIAEFDSNGSRQTTGRLPVQAAPGQACMALGDAMVIALRIGIRRELASLSKILVAHNVQTLRPEGEPDCARALGAARQAGLAR